MRRGSSAQERSRKLDALAAALTTNLCASESSTAVAIGHEADGVLVLPQRPARSYRPRN